MGKRLVSDASRSLIQVMLADQVIAEKLFENYEDKEKYKICTVNETGTVIMGKTRYPWWNNIIKCQDKLQFVDFALRVWSALVDLSSGLNNEAIKKGLSQEIIEKSIREGKYDDVVNRLFDCYRHVAQKSSGYQKPQRSEDSVETHNVYVAEQQPRQIVININGKKKYIPIVDSIGDPIGLDLEIGFTGVHQVYP